MKIIFDFDHTLFSAKKLYQAFQKAFEKLGVDEKLFQETFEKSKRKGRNYKPEKQFKLITQEKPEISIKKFEKTFEEVLNQSNKFLYPDVLTILKKLRRDNDLIILSYGEDWFQRKKIKKSLHQSKLGAGQAKIAYFFKKIFITQDINKVSTLKRFLKKGEKAIFVDDNPQALSEIKKNLPNLTTIRINRGEGKYTRELNNPQVDFSIKNLKELEKILNKAS